MPTKAEVYSVIDGERDYQRDIWKKRCAEAGVDYKPDSMKSLEEWLVFIDGYYIEAISVASHKPGGGETLDVIRKLAALCVACMENCGIVERLPKDWTGDKLIHDGLHREAVYAAIDAERDYQNSLPPARSSGSPHTVCGYLAMFDHYLRKAIDSWVTNDEHQGSFAGDYRALDNVRKLAAIVVRCMEEHGAPPRKS